MLINRPFKNRGNIIQFQWLTGRRNNFQDRAVLIFKTLNIRKLTLEKLSIYAAQTLGKLIKSIKGKSPLFQFLTGPFNIKENSFTEIDDGIDDLLFRFPASCKRDQFPAKKITNILFIFRSGCIKDIRCKSLERINYFRLGPAGDYEPHPFRCFIKFRGNGRSK